jgi:hypothetical protein
MAERGSDRWTRGCRSSGAPSRAGDMEYVTPKKRYDHYIPTGKPPPITLPKLKFLEEKDDG